MKLARLISDIRLLFLDQSQPAVSLLHLVTFFLIGWALVPESIYYSIWIWLAASLLWVILFVVKNKSEILNYVFGETLWVVAVWPVYTTLLWISGRGMLHRKFLAIALVMAIGLWYLRTKQYPELAALARLSMAILCVIVATTMVQLITQPDIARLLAVGRDSRNFRASALLANFQTVYSVSLVTVVLSGLWILRVIKRSVGWLISLIGCALMVAFANYDIALIGLSIGLFLVLVTYRKKWFSGQVSLQNKPEWLGTITMYATPAIGMLVFRPSIYRFIQLIDYESISMPIRLLNRIWVYLRSIYLYLEYPLLGFGVEPMPSSFLSGQHSDYLDILAEYGLLGWFIFFIPWITALFIVRNSLPQKARRIYWVGVIVFHFLMIFNPILDILSVTIMFLVLPGLCLITNDEESQIHGGIIL